MSKNLGFARLIDIYGSALTEKQRDAIELYYNEDLSLAEIAEHTGITRQGVLDSIKRSEANLTDLDSRLHLSGKFAVLYDNAEALESSLEFICAECKKYNYSAKLSEASENALSGIRKMKEQIYS